MIAILVPIIIAIIVAFAYAYSVPPLFNEDAECTMSSTDGCGEVECVQP